MNYNIDDHEYDDDGDDDDDDGDFVDDNANVSGEWFICLIICTIDKVLTYAYV